MSPASHMVGRLRKLYGIVWGRMRSLNERSMHPPVGGQGTAPHCMVEQLEPRLLLSGQGFDFGGQNAPTYAVGSNPWSVAAADVDGDGYMDLVTANANSNSVSVLRNRGDGTFEAQVTYAVGNSPRSVAAADVDGDGHVDLVTANYNSGNPGSVSVLRNRGDGTFEAQVAYPVGYAPRSVTAADVDGDGHVDLVTTNSYPSSVSVLRNRGDGTFEAQMAYAVGSSPSSVTAADVDGDGHMDLVTANSYSNNVSVLRNRGNGTFEAQRAYAVGSSPSSVTAADVDGDGHLDLVTANSSSSSVSVLRNRGNGTFEAQVAYAVGSSPSSVAAADVDGDGHLDLVTANSSSNNVSVLRNRGDGTFQAQRAYAVGSSPSSVTAADVDGDGHMDLVTANSSTSGSVSVLRNRGDGTFEARVACAVGSGGSSVTAADVDGDGYVDLVMTSGSVSVLRNRGDGTFEAQVAYAVGSGASSVTAADVDGDGHVDLVAMYGGNYDNRSGSVLVLRNRGDGTFEAQVTYAVGGVGGLPCPLAAADFDGDGHVDLVTTNFYLGSVSVLRNRGDGTFEAPVVYPAGSYPYARSVAAADVDGDGHVDLVTVTVVYDQVSVSVLRNRGDGTFEAPVVHIYGSTPFSVTAADVDGDGHVDLVTVTVVYDQVSVSVLRNRGDGTFEAPVIYAVGSYPSSVVAADVDGDGHVDLVTVKGDFDFGSVSVLRNRGDGTFEAPVIYAVGSYPYSVVAADVDGDGYVDLVMAESGSVSVLRNRAGERVVIAPDLAPLRVAVVRPSDAGEPFGIVYTVTNVGDAPAQGQWFDEVYLSSDPIFSPTTDHLLSTIPQVHDLAPGEEYTTRASASFPDAGSYYVIVRLNSTGSLQEQSNGVSNVLVGDLFSLSPATQGQLTVESAGLDKDEYQTGEGTQAHLRLRNDSSFTIGILVQHALYLSADPAWDWRDTLLAQFEQPAGMQPWDSVELSATCAIPPVLPGTYYLLAKADVADAVAEGDAGEADNTSVVGTVVIDAISLESGVSVAGTFSADMPSMSYRIGVGADDSEVRIYLDGSGGANELYMARDRIPTRSSYDFRYLAPFAPDQLVVMPQADAGTYYILAYGAGMPPEGTTYSLTAWVYEEPQVDAIDPGTVVNDDLVVFHLSGHCLHKLSPPRLKGPDGIVIEPLQTSLLPNGDYLARYDLRFVPEGEYRLITSDGTSIAGTQVAEVGQAIAASTNGGPSVHVTQSPSSWSLLTPVGDVHITLTGPNEARMGRMIGLDIDWSNYFLLGDDIYAPLWVLSVTPVGTAPAGVVLHGGSGPTKASEADKNFVCEIADGYTMDYMLLSGENRKMTISAAFPSTARPGDEYTFTLSLLPDHYPINGDLAVKVTGQATSSASLSASGLLPGVIPSQVTSSGTVPTSESPLSASASDAGLTREIRIWKAEGTGGSAVVLQQVTSPSQVDPTLQTDIIVPGWKAEAPEMNVWMQSMALAIAYKTSDQVLLVDTGDYFGTIDYVHAAGSVLVAGTDLESWLRTVGFSSAANVHFIGHSLGAYAAAEAARLLGGHQHVTSLDAAAPRLSPQPISGCATYVDHYNSSALGLAIASTPGTENFVLMVPDSIQGITQDDYHAYAHKWYTETIWNASNVYDNLGFNRSSGSVQHGMITLNGGLINLDSRTWAIYKDPLEITPAFSKTLTVRIVGSVDPNDKSGPEGWGDEGYVQREDRMNYQVSFENLPTATASAQEVVVTDQLDQDMDWTSFELREIAFGNHVISLPAGSTHFEGVTEYSVGGFDLLVRTSVELDISTGVIEARFTCADPATGTWPVDPFAGFLPPNDESGLGEGRIVYSIRPRADAPSGTAITNQASIVFDTNPAIETPVVHNTIDAGAPSSGVQALPDQISQASFVVQWAGQDDTGGSGIGSYDVYVSDNGGPYALWKDDTTDTSATFTGVPGHTFAFYSVARDNVGHVEEVAGVLPDAQTYVNTPPAPDAGPDGAIDEGQAFIQSGTFTDGDGYDVGLWMATVDYDDGSGEQSLALDGMTFALSHVYADNGAYGITVTVTDTQGITGTDKVGVTVGNVAPVVNGGADRTADEGQLVGISASFTDAGSADTHTATIDWGDGTVEQAFAATSPVAGNHTYADNGIYAAVVTVLDDDGGIGTDTILVTVLNVAPTIDTLTGDSSVTLGGQCHFAAVATDPAGAADPLTYTWNFGDGSTPLSGVGLTEVDHTYSVAGPYTVTLTATDGDDGQDQATWDVMVRPVPSTIAGRYVFYNASYWDGNSPTANVADDAAIAPDKQALLPGQTATFANYTSYSRGLNGIMIDVSNLPPGTPTTSDFEFRVGNSNTPASWPLATVTPTISVRPGAGVGGSDRVTLTFPDASAAGQWLRVEVLAGGSVGLAAPDVFYFGNAIGKVGNLTTDEKVTVLDISATRANQTTYANPPEITNLYDFNRDHRVNTLDVSLVRSCQTTYATALKVITAPAESPLGIDQPAVGGDGGLVASLPRVPLGTSLGTELPNDDGVVYAAAVDTGQASAASAADEQEPPAYAAEPTVPAVEPTTVAAATATARSTSTTRPSETMDALASRVATTPAPKLGALLGTALIDALAATRLTSPL